MKQVELKVARVRLHCSPGILERPLMLPGMLQKPNKAQQGLLMAVVYSQYLRSGHTSVGLHGCIMVLTFF